MTMKPDEASKMMSKINTGGTAHVVLNHIGPKFRAQELAIISSFKLNHRAGKFDAVAVAAGIATLCAIEDMENSLRQEINTGHSAQVKVNKES